MPKFAANLTMMYHEFEFLDRFAASARDGFQAVEFLFPYACLAGDIKARLNDAGLTQVLFNLPPGDWAAGERGVACLPGREEEFRRGVERALGYASVLGTKTLHVMAGIVPSEMESERCMGTYLRNLAYAAHQAEVEGITVVIEPINRRDMPGYLLSHQAQAHGICKDIGLPNLKVLMDLYHCQITEGDLIRRIQQHIGNIAHIQIAGVPERQEPDTGEVRYERVIDVLDDLGYEGWIGCEYRPRSGTSAGLGWLRSLRKPRSFHEIVE